MLKTLGLAATLAVAEVVSTFEEARSVRPRSSVTPATQ